MKKWFSILPVSALIVSLFMLHSCSGSAQETQAAAPVVPQAVVKSVYQNVDVADFKKIMQEDPNAVVLDVRTPRETAMGKIEGAIEIDISNPNFAGEVQKLDKSKTYLVYCRSGRRSVSACQLMQQEGFQNLYNLRGGILAWNAQQ